MDVGFISLSPTSTSPICQVHFTYVANTKFNYGKLVAWQIWQVDFTCPPCSLCRVAKSKSTPPTCQITKSTLPSHQVHIGKSLPPYWEQFESSNHEFYFFLVSNLSEWCVVKLTHQVHFFFSINFLTMSNLCSWMKLILMDESNPIDWMNFICGSCSKCNDIDLDACTMTQQDEPSLYSNTK